MARKLNGSRQVNRADVRNEAASVFDFVLGNLGNFHACLFLQDRAFPVPPQR